MSTHSHEPDQYSVGAVVEMLADDPEEDHRRGDRGTILVRDALGDLHIDWDRGRVGVWTVAEAREQLRVIEEA